jgi:dihydroorotase
VSAGAFGRLTDPRATLLIAGARLIDPSAGTDAIGDLTVLEGVIVDVAAAPAGIERVAGTGMVVAPGFVDLHTHLREPGGESAETIESGSRAAARGGFTSVCAMPNTDPPLDTVERVEAVAERARAAAAAVRVIGAVTRGRDGAELADLEGLAAAAAAAFSDDGTAVSERVLRDAMVRLAQLGLPLIEHAEDPGLAAGAVMRAGPAAARLGLAGWPADAELGVVERDIAMAEETGARLHLTHLSSRGAVEAVRDAKARGVAVTADVTPHHLALTDEWVGGSRRFSWEDAEDGVVAPNAYDGSCRVNPPLASREDALALLAGVRDGVIDAIATDHAPHPPERKLVPFGEASPGLIGLETALSLGLAAVAAGALTLPVLLAALSTRPAAVIGERRTLAVGAPADLTMFDPGARWRVDRSALASRSANTPLMGMELPGVVRLTLASGRVTYRLS